MAELPRAFKPLFSGFKYFNGVQAEMLDFVLSTSESFVVSAWLPRRASRATRPRGFLRETFSHSCVFPPLPALSGAPTGSGKTVLLELAIVQMLLDRVNRANGAFEHRPGERKAIYMAPLKALVQEKKEDWIARFAPLGVTCRELTGDADVKSWSELRDVDVILTTPEKFDSVTRKNKDRGGMSFFGDVALVMIDEVHLLGDERGGALEAVVSRLKTLSARPDLLPPHAPLRDVRFAACSATVSNLGDVGRWLGAPEPDGVRRFGEEYRPVTLETAVLAFEPAKNDFLFERRLNDRLHDVVLSHFEGKPTLVFCNSRDGAANAARELASRAERCGARANPYVRDEATRRRLAEAASRVASKPLARAVACGVGFHSSALEFPDRDLVEQLFRGRLLTVLCSTSTLAMGVNLPAFLCVIRGTRQYVGAGEYAELDRGAVLQMCGRAGRPQFDERGKAVIMTQRSTKAAYDGLVHGTDPIESNLGLALAEHLNAEIASGVVAHARAAVEWLRHSFFHIRVGANPRRYASLGVDPGSSADAACERIVTRTLGELGDAGMCRVTREGGANGRVTAVAPLDAGTIMSDLYVKFATMRELTRRVPHPASVADLLLTLCGAEEFSGVKLRRDEKKQLKEWNLAADEPALVRFKVTEPGRGKSSPARRVPAKAIRTAAEKLFVCAQVAMSDDPAAAVPPGMRLETETVFVNGRRIMQAAARYYAKRVGGADGGFAACCNALRLAKALEMRCWDDTTRPMRQIPQCGKKSVAALADAGYRTLDDVLHADPRALERVVNRAFPHGDNLLACVRALPPATNVRVRVREAWRDGVVADVEVSRTPGGEPAEEGRSGRGASAGARGAKRWTATLVVGCTWRDALLHVERVTRAGGDAPAAEDVALERVVRCGTLPRPGEAFTIVAALLFDECVGRDARDVVNGVVPGRGRRPATVATPQPRTAPERAPLAANAAIGAEETPPTNAARARVPTPPSRGARDEDEDEDENAPPKRDEKTSTPPENRNERVAAERFVVLFTGRRAHILAGGG